MKSIDILVIITHNSNKTNNGYSVFYLIVENKHPVVVKENTLKNYDGLQISVDLSVTLSLHPFDWYLVTY